MDDKRQKAIDIIREMNPGKSDEELEVIMEHDLATIRQSVFEDIEVIAKVKELKDKRKGVDK